MSSGVATPYELELIHDCLYTVPSYAKIQDTIDEIGDVTLHHEPGFGPDSTMCSYLTHAAANNSYAALLVATVILTSIDETKKELSHVIETIKQKNGAYKWKEVTALAPKITDFSESLSKAQACIPIVTHWIHRLITEGQ